MLDQCQQFKLAFLRECLAHDVSLDDAHAMVKEACEALTLTKEGFVWPWLKENVPGLSLGADIAGGTAKGLASQAPALAVGAYLGAPIAAGGLVGYGLAQLEGLNDEDPEEIRTQEKIEAYQRSAARAALQKRLRDGRNARRPNRPLL